MDREESVDAIVVGAGFGGIHALHECRKRGMSVRGVETGSDVGGTWFWNRYPGARCDVESLTYSYSFSAELDAAWRWTERYPTQPEILRYIRFAANLFNVHKLIRFDSTVSSARYDETTNRWTVTLDSGDAMSCRFLIMATGPLTKVVWPDIAGINQFQGERYHTARWPEYVSLKGKRIGVIGNGSSGTQFMTVVAEEAGELHAFIRTPQYSVPALNAPLNDDHYALWESEKERIRSELHLGMIAGSGDVFADRSVIFNKKPIAHYTTEEQRELLEYYWNIGGAQLVMAFSDIMIDDGANSVTGDFAREKIIAKISDPAKAAKLTPRFAFGGKRIIVDTGFFEIFNQDNVFVHDIRSAPVVGVTEKGLETTEGEVELDVLVFATGFDAVTGSYDRIDIRGRDGLKLADHWANGAKSYMGIAVAGFPNLLMVNGPGAPGPLSNVVVTNEWCVEVIFTLIDRIRAVTLGSVEATPESEEAWMALVEQVCAPTFFAKTDNWYTGANVKNKRRGIVNLASARLFKEKIKAAKESNFDQLRFERASSALS